ncbi:hypothetical protein CSUI_007765 [Cystoisospora suis]|uniref:Uncharacterized protein n=1 Tax=Cystoisospora suis TaxID=483139 RepID=A0A2C6KPI3_9APIC|nr:hypothetical protein CSUI_007765 [Cystoisospora suis]
MKRHPSSWVGRSVRLCEWSVYFFVSRFPSLPCLLRIQQGPLRLSYSQRATSMKRYEDPSAESHMSCRLSERCCERGLSSIKFTLYGNRRRNLSVLSSSSDVHRKAVKKRKTTPKEKNLDRLLEYIVLPQPPSGCTYIHLRAGGSIGIRVSCMEMVT